MPHTYPQEAAIGDGRRLLLRPFAANDTAALHAFFLRMPESVRRQAWDRIEDRGVVEQWGRGLDYSKTFPLLALDDDDRIVADATLHFRQHGPLRHVGRIRWLVDPESMNQGLETTLVRQMIDIAKKEGLRRLSCLLSTDLESEGVATLKGLGFLDHVIPGYGTDPDGKPLDMTLLVLEL